MNEPGEKKGLTIFVGVMLFILGTSLALFFTIGESVDQASVIEKAAANIEDIENKIVDDAENLISEMNSIRKLSKNFKSALQNDDQLQNQALQNDIRNLRDKLDRSLSYQEIFLRKLDRFSSFESGKESIVVSGFDVVYLCLIAITFIFLCSIELNLSKNFRMIELERKQVNKYHSIAVVLIIAFALQSAVILSKTVNPKIQLGWHIMLVFQAISILLYNSGLILIYLHVRKVLARSLKYNERKYPPEFSE
jgi:hypothetical protein